MRHQPNMLIETYVVLNKWLEIVPMFQHVPNNIFPGKMLNFNIKSNRNKKVLLKGVISDQRANCYQGRTDGRKK